MTSVNHLFLISSAINTKFGWFTPHARLRQVYKTVNSILYRIPNAKVIIIESSGWRLDSDQLSELKNISDYVFDFSGNDTIKEIHDSNPKDNWDGVKNSCEVACYYKVLNDLDDLLKTSYKDIHRIHKISGRYELNENFNKYLYESERDKIVFAEKQPTQFIKKELNLNIKYQYMSRLWSWPIEFHSEIKNFYFNALTTIIDTYANNKYVDIEHLLYNHFKNNNNVLEVPKIGVEGLIAGNGQFIDD